MNKTLMLALIGCLSEGLLTLQAQDTNIAGLFSTGQGQTPAGQVDLHYTLNSAPIGYTDVFVASATPAAWNTLSFANAHWVSAIANANLDVATGDYTYRLTFNLENAGSEALDPLTAHIIGSWCVDNYGMLLLNGNLVGTCGSLDTADYSGFSTPAVIDLASGFVSGVNTLDFKVSNLTATPNPSGLVVQFSSATATLVPEPGTLALSVAGVALLGVWRGRKRLS